MRSRWWRSLFVLVLTVLWAGSVQAALITRLGGQAVYDDVLDITWLRNANLAASETFGVSGIASTGRMTYWTANAWINAMNAHGGTGYLGFDNWRLPVHPLPGGGLDEMHYQFYGNFGATVWTNVYSTGDPVELAKFSGLQAQAYWTGSWAGGNDNFTFSYSNGRVDQAVRSTPNFAWAVRSGDVGVVPEPSTGVLLALGLTGLGIARERRRSR